jgi:hypothetical protein
MNQDITKFENALQLGGIRTGTLDAPGACGALAELRKCDGPIHP